MGVTASLAEPFYVSSSAAASATDLQGFPVALGGRPFQVDWVSARDVYRRYTVQLVRQQADQSERPSERSINPEGLWRRSFTSWHLGRGQQHTDRDGSEDARFRESRRVDVWDKWSLSLLPATVEVRAVTGTNLLLAAAAGYLYSLDGQTVAHTAALAGGSTSWTTVTGTPAATAQAVVSDGTTVYVSFGASGIYTSALGAASMASWNTLPCGPLGFVKGRLMAANGASIYNVTSSSPPAALYTHPNSAWTWVGFAEGINQIYAAGYAGERSLVYRTAVKADGTALDVPVVAGPALPDGERVQAIYGYLGFVFLGTSLGVRLCQPDASGDLTIGPVLEAGSVRCFEGQGRFVWFGVDAIDGATCGLGRLDLTQFVDTLAPAHAYDLEVATPNNGNVVSVATFGGDRVFGVAGSGVWAEASTFVTSGYVASGQTSWGLTDQKIMVALDLAHDTPAAGSVEAYLSADGAAETLVGAASTGVATLSTQERRGVAFDLKVVLTGDGAVTPVVSSLTLRANPSVAATEKIRVPLVLAARVDGDDGGRLERNPADDRDFIRRLRQTGEVTTWVEEGTSTRVMIEDFVWRPERVNQLGSYDGQMVVEMKVVEA